MSYYNWLQDKERHVDELAAEMEASKANVSQHLSILWEKGVVERRKEGLRAYYSISNPKLIRACELMKEIMLERMADMAEFSRKFINMKGEGDINEER